MLEHCARFIVGVALVMTVFYVGTLFFGHFEEHKPKWKRLLKVAAFIGFTVWLSSLGLRKLAYDIILGVGSLFAAVVHLYWLPKNGVNGWTGEPKDKYYALIGHKKKT